MTNDAEDVACESRDRPVKSGARQSERTTPFEINKSAIAAGLEVLLESGALYYATESHYLLVEDILRTSLKSAGYYLRVLKDRPQVV